MKKRKCVLLLGGSTDQLFIINTAHEMGLETAVIDGDRLAPGLAISTYSASIDFSDVAAVVDYVKSLMNEGVNVCGVSVMGSDVPHIVAVIAKEFDWSGPSLQTGKWATDKYEMKCHFAKEGIPVPNFTLVNSSEDVKYYWKEWDCKTVIVKPTDRAGSRGVSLLTNENDAQMAYERALSYSRNGKIILEEYIHGQQISTESILTETLAITPGFADRVYEDMDVFWPQVIENGGWVPSAVDQSMQNKVVKVVEKGARVMGIERGVAKGDVVIHPQRGPMIIEMAARLSGGDFSESLVPLGSGINYVKTALQLAIGDDPVLDDMLPRWQKTVANRYFFLPPGKLEAIDGLESLDATEGVKKLRIFYNIGDTIPEIRHHGQRVGVMIVVGENRRIVQENINRVYQSIRFKIGGHWMKGDPRQYAEASYANR